MLWILLQQTTATPVRGGGWNIPAVPDPLNWAFGIAGLLALVLAMITVPQVLWGRANVSIRFKVTPQNDDGQMALMCILANKPAPRFVRPFLDRHTAEATVAFWVYDGRGADIAQLFPDIIVGLERRGHRIQIPATPADQPEFAIALERRRG